MIVTVPTPRGGQVEFYKKKSRFLVAVVGRQYGKSTIASLRLIKRAMAKPGVYWWVAPISNQSRVQFKRIYDVYRQLISEVNRTYMELRLINGSVIAFKGSDNKEALRGETLAGAVLDECATMSDDLWPEIIRPMLAKEQGWCDFIGTPKGKNWFYNLYNSATGEEWDRYAAPSIESPFFPKREFEDIKRSTPERTFRQEYEAEFLDDGGEVFRGVSRCIQGSLEEPQSGRDYVMGVDLAKHYDFTVCTVWDMGRKHLVAYDRFNQIDWPTQKIRINNLRQKYTSNVVIDSTGVGDPIFDELARTGINITPVRFTHSSKLHLIDNLSVMIENQEITFPHIPELISELNIYSVEKTRSGKTTYNAPSGYHDDIVISMALACSELRKGRRVEVFGL